MKSKQFELVPLFCPHCGRQIGEQAYYQSFEYKVAKWLKGETVPVATAGFDVWKCERFPELTIQVKYAIANHFQPKDKKYPQITWAWISNSQQPKVPDFFVLFGVNGDTEYVFVLSRAEFFRYARAYKNQFGHTKYSLYVCAKEKSDRKNYLYKPKIWRYLVENPSETLESHIIAYQSRIIQGDYTQLPSLEDYIDNLPQAIRELNLLGFTQGELSKWSHLSMSTVGRIVRGLGNERWAKNYDACQKCSTTEIPHCSKGLCVRCYHNTLYHKKVNSESMES